MAKKAFEVLSEGMLYVLMALEKENMCGIEIVDFVKSLTQDRVKIGPGTLYTILAKFEEEGLIREIKTDGRKRTYAITQSGLTIFEAEVFRLEICLKDVLISKSLKEKSDD